MGSRGLGQYIDQWRLEWQWRTQVQMQVQGAQQSDLVDNGRLDGSLSALLMRVNIIYDRVYPILQQNPDLDMHAILAELLARQLGGSMTVPMSRRAPQVSLPLPLGQQQPQQAQQMERRTRPIMQWRLRPFELVDIDQDTSPFAVDLVASTYTSNNELGHLSEEYTVTLAGARRELLPAKATTFRYAYPVERDPVPNAGGAPHGSLAVRNFRTLGGYLYFGPDGALCGVKAMALHDGESHIGFEPMVRLTGMERLRTSLFDRNTHRPQPAGWRYSTTLGTVWQCWIRPGEEFTSVDQAGDAWPHGAFAFFFEDASRDCYFAIRRGWEQPFPGGFM